MSKPQEVAVAAKKVRIGRLPAGNRAGGRGSRKGLPLPEVAPITVLAVQRPGEFDRIHAHSPSI
jgi:hypothetical protein